MGWGKCLKRIIDIMLSILLMIILSPIFLIVVIMVYINTGFPLIFAQMRPGLHGKPFKIYKFRSMNDERDSEGRLLPDQLRLSALGKFLRSSSMDELPEFINVLKGDMSLVGPRPLLMQYLERYTPEQSRRHELRPGITGWAQINGRNAISWEERFALDIWYIDNWSMRLDFKILILTLARVFAREGINARGEATMPEFVGSSQASSPGPIYTDMIGSIQAAASQDDK